MTNHAITVLCQSLEEAAAAIAAIDSHRRGIATVKPGVPDLGNGTFQSGDGTDDLAGRVEAALRKSVPNRARTIMLETLLQSPAGSWLPFSEIEAAFERAGLRVEKARAALSYFSWQMKEYMPNGDLEGLTKSIEVMAERSRMDGDHLYRLTPEGRIAVERLLGSGA